MSRAGLRIEVRGTVQGVGFRPWVYRLARELGLQGTVRNHTAGVTIEAFGPKPALERLLERLRSEAPPGARLSEIEARPASYERRPGFAIAPSRSRRERVVSIPPDLATCEACSREVSDPRDRRHGYAFTNCTGCGPRYTISRAAPYDRGRTTMARFRMCAACAREYQDPKDRRFHAEPNACPACGPRLELRDAAGTPVPAGDPLGRVAEALLRGAIVAVKGIGGFHLACDATRSEVVKRLRDRKRRQQKPFAVMVRDLRMARALAELGDAEAKLLQAVERPIVLVSRREEAAGALCSEVAPGLSQVGLLLPYTPLHHLLLARVDRPLVMTSGNLSDEPICFRNGEAMARLRGIADLFLVHDREIAARCDDSVASVIAGAPTVLRRARGYVPRPVRLARRLPQPVLACGAHLKNSICLGVGDLAYLGPHVGDLETLEAYEAFQESVERLQRFVGVEPEVVAFDLHPDYLSTRYALERPAGIRHAVQHHHAHVASALAENGEEGPVLGLAWDGTGHGPDGRAWGGELLLADLRGYRRLATFRPLRLPGGDRAIREVWRLALAALWDAFEGAPPLDRFPLFEHVPEASLRGVLAMLERDLNAPRAHGVGRYFDAFGALALGRPSSDYEGQVALAWNLLAGSRPAGAYPFRIDFESKPWQVDLRATLCAAAGELDAGAPAARVSARFHDTLVEVADRLVRAAVRRFGRYPVCLSGGCFQNRRLTEDILRRLGRDFRVLRHREVPPGDGGIALGQLAVAGARLEAEGAQPCV